MYLSFTALYFITAQSATEKNSSIYKKIDPNKALINDLDSSSSSKNKFTAKDSTNDDDDDDDSDDDDDFNGSGDQSLEF